MKRRLAQLKWLMIVGISACFPSKVMRKRTRHFLKNVQLVDMATAFNFRRLRVELNVCHAEIRALMIWKCLLHHPSALTRRAALIDYGIRYDKRFLSVIDQKLDFEVALKAERQK